MQKLAAIGLLAVVLIYGQTARDPMLPVARPISGVVVDTSSKPLVGFRVDHRGFGWYEVDAGGKFQFDSRAPAVVFRKPGYNSYYLRTASASEARIVLEQAVTHGGPAECPNNAMCISIGSWGRRRFLEQLGETASYRDADADAARILDHVLDGMCLRQ